MTVLSLPPLEPTTPAGIGAPDDDSPLRSVSTAVAVLDCFASEAELGATKVAARLGIAKSTACRMLAALATGGLLERTGSGRYRLGLRLFEYGQLAVDRLMLRDVALPAMGDLRELLRETVQLGVVVGTDVLYVERAEAAGMNVRFRSEHRRNPAHSSSTGRVLAAADPALVTAILERGLRRYTPFTVVDPLRYRQILAQTSEQGYATSREEFEPGWSSLAAPITLTRGGRPHPVAALSVVGVTSRVLGPRKPAVVQGLRRAAARVSADLERGRH
jgi:IclR family transcriptional regulator, KDG regulon repressor